MDGALRRMRARRRALLALLAVLGLAVPAPAQPPASLKILIPADPGGSWDQMARAMEQALRTEKLVAGPIRLTNHGGGDGTVGLARFARAKGEAGSLMVMGQTMIAAIVTGGSPRTLASVTPIARLTSEPAVIVVPASSPFRTLKDLTERLKKDADTVSITGFQISQGSVFGSDGYPMQVGATGNYWVGLARNASSQTTYQIQVKVTSGGLRPSTRFIQWDPYIGTN